MLKFPCLQYLNEDNLIDKKKPYQIDRVKNLHFSNLVTAGVGQKAVVIVDGQGTQSVGVRGRVPNRVQDLHVSYVVNV